MGKNKQISILVDEEILAEIDASAALAGRSRNWVINRRLGVWPVYGGDGRVVGMVPSIDPGKKIAGSVEGGGAQDGGGTPDLSRSGKAQDGDIFDGPHLLTAKDGSTAYCDPRSCKWCAEGWTSNRGGEIVLKARSAGISTLAAEMNARAEYLIPDGVSCGHAGCLSHVSHPCEGCGRIGGRRVGVLGDGTICDENPVTRVEPEGGWDKCGTCGQIHGVGEYFNHNFVSQKKSAAEVPIPEFILENMSRAAGLYSTPIDPPKWALAWSLEVESGTPRGFKNCSPKLLEEIKEAAKTDGAAALVLHQSGIELDREILVRWGLAENYKPKLEEKGGAQRIGKAGKSGGVVGKDAGSHATGNDGSEGAAVGVGKPGVNMDALRDICEGKGIRPAPLSAEPVEVDLCGFKSYNEIDGENYVCGKEVHGPKVKHGEWIKI